MVRLRFEEGAANVPNGSREVIHHLLSLSKICLRNIYLRKRKCIGYAGTCRMRISGTQIIYAGYHTEQLSSLILPAVACYDAFEQLVRSEVFLVGMI